MLIGYARTSTQDQVAGFQDQLNQLQATGCEKVFQEQVSSVSERAQLDAMLGFVRSGDCIVITKIDRLARNVGQLSTIANDLAARGVGLKVLGTDIDTSTASGRLVLNLLGSIAQHEREQMLERQKVGIAKAKADGVYKGRVPTAARQSDTVRKLAADGLGPTEIAAQLGMSRQSVWRITSKGSTAH
jgi:DNA invertase Pin-like site-specific DNA recombinase